MCGIVGYVSALGAEPPDRARLDRAVAALRHRGPDGSGTWVDDAVALGHTRLSIIDVEGGAQPLASEDGRVLTVYNGEIWNHVELRRELEHAGHRFRTRCDTEVLVHGYEEWGERLLDRLDGMFAFAIWDSSRQRLLLGRDRVGKKPLYVARTAAGLAFGSDARSVLLVAGLRPAVRPECVAEFLFQRYVVSPRTLFAGVDRLPPAHVLSYDRRRVEQRAYWELRPRAERPLDPRELRERLRESVGKRLMSDVPLGVLLSGGVDSNAVLGLMREVGASDIASFTIGFDNPLYDERPLARLGAHRFGTEHHEVLVGRSDFQAALPRLSWYRDEPLAEPSEIPLILLAEEAGRHVKVVLSGDGSDELYGGYPKYVADRLLRLPVPGRVALLRLAGRGLATRPSHRRMERAIETMGIEDEALRWASWFRTFSADEVPGLLAPGLSEQLAGESLGDSLRTLLAAHAELDPGRRMLLGDFLTYLPDNMLLRTDKVLMGASVEGRMPLLDHHVVERVSDVPVGRRLGWRTPKALLRRAIADLVPREILHGVKRGFPVPTARLLLDDGASSLRPLLTSERLAERGLVRADLLAALIEAGPVDSSAELKLFTLASLELWLRANVDRIRETPPESIEELLEPAELTAVETARMAEAS